MGSFAARGVSMRPCAFFILVFRASEACEFSFKKAF